MTSLGPWRFVDAGEVNALHAEAISKYGGLGGLRDQNCPDDKVKAAITAALYDADGKAEDLLRAVAYVVVYLTRGHCYIDGNKRVAWMTALRTLEINGFGLTGNETEAQELVERVAKGLADVDEVTSWIGHPERLCALSQLRS